MIRQKLIERINNAESVEAILETCKRVGVHVDLEDLGEVVWIRQKTNITDRRLQALQNPRTDRFFQNVDKIKAVLVDDFYINLELDLKIHVNLVEVAS